MKLSTARKLVCMSYFTVDGLRPLLATATRIVCSGDTRRFLFPDGSVIESVKGNWKVVGMEKNPKLDAAVRRFGKGPFVTGGYTGSPDGSSIESYGVGPFEQNADMLNAKAMFEECFCVEHGLHIEQLKKERDGLQELLNQKDEQLDQANEAVMVVRLDWWAVALVGLVLVAHYVFKVL